MDEAGIAQKLDVILSILKIAYKENIAELRAEIGRDATKSAVVSAASNWIGGGELTKSVVKKAKTSERSAQRAMAELVDFGVLEKRGAASSTEYKRTGLI